MTELAVGEPKARMFRVKWPALIRSAMAATAASGPAQASLLFQRSQSPRIQRRGTEKMAAVALVSNPKPMAAPRIITHGHGRVPDRRVRATIHATMSTQSAATRSFFALEA